MKQQEIINKLYENHKSFSAFIDSLSDLEFNFVPTEKWTAGQQLDHILRSVKPLNKVFLLPTFLIQLIFGKANRPSKTYEELVNKYLSKIQNGAKASGQFVPKSILLNEKKQLIQCLSTQIKKLNSHIHKLSEKDLDTIVLPHPLLGKLTLREMLYFTIYHVEHHLEITKRDILTYLKK